MKAKLLINQADHVRAWCISRWNQIKQMPDAASDTNWSYTVQHSLQMTHILAYTTFNSAQGEARSPWLLFSGNVINSEQVKGSKCVYGVCVCVFCTICSKRKESFSSAKRTTRIRALWLGPLQAAIVIVLSLCCNALTTSSPVGVIMSSYKTISYPPLSLHSHPEVLWWITTCVCVWPCI